MKYTPRSLCLAVALLSLTACGGQSADDHMEEARKYLAASDYQAATIELKNALQQDGSTAEARWLLGKLYLDQGDALSAEKELDRAQKLGWDANDVRPALASAWLATDKYAEIGELAYKDLQPEPAARLLSSQALAALARGELEQSEKLIARALEKQPDMLEVRMAEARILASAGNFADALFILQDILTQAPEHAQAWKLQGDILMSEQKYPEALAAFTKAIELSQNNFSARLKRALIALQTGDFIGAQADAEALLKAAPQHPASNYVQGLLHFRKQKYPEAITALSVAEPVAQQFPMVLFYLGSAQLIEGNQDQAAVFASRFFALAPNNIAGRKLLATIRLQQGESDKVQELIQPVLDTNPDDVGALNLMANALLRDGKTDEGISLLAKIAELQPDSATAQVRLGAGLLLSGQGDAAAEHMETALELNPEFQQADILLVLNHVQNGDIDAAIDAAKAYLRRNPASTTPHNLLGRVYLAAGQTELARESFAKALKLDPGDPAANHHLAQLEVQAGDLAAARKRYLLTLENHPDSLQALMQLVMLDAKEQNAAAMVARLQQAIETHPTALQPRLVLGRYYLSSGKPDRVAQLFTDLPEVQKQSAQVLQLLASAQLQGKDHEQAQFTLEQLLEAAPDTASAHHMMAMAAAGTGDTDRAREELQKAISLDQNYLPSLTALARVALVDKDTEAFDGYMARLLELAPEAPDVLRLRAVVARRDGDMTGAVTLSEKALAAAPTTQTLLEHVAYLKLAGDQAGARKRQQKWVADHPQDTAARLALANDLQLEGDDTAASEHYLALLEYDSTNLIALNNLAWFLREKDPENALAYIRRAAEVAPDRAEVLDTLAVIEHLQGDYRKALRNIERALAQAPGNPSMLYHKAMIEASMGDTDSALEGLNNILAEGTPDFPERVEAEKLLDSLKG